MKKVFIKISIGIIAFFLCILMLTLFSKRELTIEKAKDLYNSFAWQELGQNDVIDSNKLLKYKYKKTIYQNQECYIFDIKNSGIKLYSFPIYDTENTYLLQTVLVDEELLNRSDIFEIGCNINSVKKIYQDIILFENDHIYFDMDDLNSNTSVDKKTTDSVFSSAVKYYFEILNNSGLHTYGVDNNGNIIIKFIFDFDNMKWIT